MAEIGEIIDFEKLIEDNHVELAPASPAKIAYNDSAITAGRIIKSTKKNQLFTAVFEKSDVQNFCYIWNQFTSGNYKVLRQLLTKECRRMIDNYHKEVCPIEVMLYTSNVIASQFQNPKLVDEVAEVVLYVWHENNEYISSIEHILKVWKWEHVINILAIVVGKIGDVDLIQYVYDNYYFIDENRLFVFKGLIESKNEDFVPHILDMVRDLKGGDADRILGNFFKKNFLSNFPAYYNQLSLDMFSNSSEYVKSIMRNIITDAPDNSYVARYENAKSRGERDRIAQLGLEALLNSDKRETAYDVSRMLRMHHSQQISEKLYENMDIERKSNMPTFVTNAIITYFGTIYYENAIKKLAKMDKNNYFYAAARIALCHQDRITAGELVKSFLSETKSGQLKTYLSGFNAMFDRSSSIKSAIYEYFSGDTDKVDRSIAISNYEKLVKKYRFFFDFQMIELFKQWFGYETIFRTCDISLSEQMSCLNIIATIIDKSNYKKYENFLYYVAEQQSVNFSAPVSNRAREILGSFGLTGFKS